MFSNTRTDRDQATRERRRFSYANVMATLSVFMVLAGGTALAATTLPADSVTSKTVKDNKLKSVDLKDGKAVSGDDVIDGSLTGTDVADNSLTGDDVDESTLAGVLKANVYKKESPVAAGTTLGDGTQVISESCDPGDVMLSGGPANINANTDLLESFPSPGTTNGWTARVNKNGGVDNFSVVLLCIDQS